MIALEATTTCYGIELNIFYPSSYLSTHFASQCDSTRQKSHFKNKIICCPTCPLEPGKGAAPGTRLKPITPCLRPRPLGRKLTPSLSVSQHQPRNHAVCLRDLGRLTYLPHCAQHTKPEISTQPLRLGRLKPARTRAISHSACALGVSHCTGSAA